MNNNRQGCSYSPVIFASCIEAPHAQRHTRGFSAWPSTIHISSLHHPATNTRLVTINESKQGFGNKWAFPLQHDNTTSFWQNVYFTVTNEVRELKSSDYVQYVKMRVRTESASDLQTCTDDSALRHQSSSSPRVSGNQCLWCSTGFILSMKEGSPAYGNERNSANSPCSSNTHTSKSPSQFRCSCIPPAV